MASVPNRQFAVSDAKREHVPLLIGLTGPSGGGKTYSALRLATGIQKISGGDIYFIDTESRRALHYADKFNFKHVPFDAPFGSLDYLAALQFCVGQGAGVVIVDSMSHEHEGPGGMVDLHDQIVDRMAGNDFGKRDRVKMLAWSEPKQKRRALINGILQLNANFIFCFRAKNTAKPGKDEKGRSAVIAQGFMPIAGEEFVFEQTMNALLMPGAGGVPTWDSDMVGERTMIKLPEQFAGLRSRNRPLDEKVGEHLAQWARGEMPAEVKDGPREFVANDTKVGLVDDDPEQGPADQPANERDAFGLEPLADQQTAENPAPDDAFADWRAKAEEFLGSIRNAKRTSYLDAIADDYRAVAVQMPKELADQVEAALAAKRAELGEGGK